MKNISVAFITLFSFIASANSQVIQSKRPDVVSDLERFSLRSGQLVKKEYKDLGSKKIALSMVRWTNLQTDSVRKGLLFTYDRFTMFLDQDEIADFLKASDVLLNVPVDKALDNLEYEYRSRGGVTAICSKLLRPDSPFTKDYEYYYILFDNYVSRPSLSLSKENFSKLVQTIIANQNAF